ncbi:hypothetical protein BDP27DRAFT_1256859 [Rhodocollybia butyracea]|uniref:Cytochrome c oxidase subunit 8, mitochondrial n=1 Tax=Rhodocollybia butyracea TaxID=206335 RepID=A0A9P5UD76_9AGAR|nr:hypothetical protein BDP27DRAFT_1256859 [Rhodocollybia butyracea]
MSFTLASRSARTGLAVLKRQLHTSNVARSGHGEYHHLPFAWPHTNSKTKTSFAIKLTAYLGLGFSIPFIAASYQLKKSGN